jgi:predicted AAA+ superfamily ATPase
MTIIKRQLETTCRSDLKAFPVLTITGPRQSGRSTLLKSMLPDWSYVNLEDPSQNDFATEDPKAFLRTYSNQVIFDEIQRAPKLLSYLQVEIDNDRRPGRFALSGSHNLLLLQSISQSLAGRTSIRHLLPFSYSELASSVGDRHEIEDQLFYGFYPAVWNQLSASGAWLDSYIQTYIERDVRLIRNVTDLGQFRRFLKLCAGRASQILDLSSLGKDVGLSHNSVREWIGVLETGFIAYRLEPFYQNFSKRVIKSPKLYFYDTGVLCRLLAIGNSKDLELSPFRGAIFENWCVNECLKSLLNRGQQPSVYFWKDKSMEVDIVMEMGAGKISAFECKSSVTSPSNALEGPNYLQKVMTGYNISKSVVYAGSGNQTRSDGSILDWRSFALGL